MPKGKRGISISVERQSGSVEFLSKYSKLYALQNGLLIPLKRVTFSGGTWYTINICKREFLESSSAAESKVVIRINESNVNGNCIVAFIFPSFARPLRRGIRKGRWLSLNTVLDISNVVAHSLTRGVGCGACDRPEGCNPDGVNVAFYKSQQNSALRGVVKPHPINPLTCQHSCRPAGIQRIKGCG